MTYALNEVEIEVAEVYLRVFGNLLESLTNILDKDKDSLEELAKIDRSVAALWRRIKKIKGEEE